VLNISEQSGEKNMVLQGSFFIHVCMEYMWAWIHERPLYAKRNHFSNPKQNVFHHDKEFFTPAYQWKGHELTPLHWGIKMGRGLGR
jgi:hypothetical protein